MCLSLESLLDQKEDQTEQPTPPFALPGVRWSPPAYEGVRWPCNGTSLDALPHQSKAVLLLLSRLLQQAGQQQ